LAAQVPPLADKKSPPGGTIAIDVGVTAALKTTFKVTFPLLDTACEPKLALLRVTSKTEEVLFP
jgi:hypothetical protein